MKRIFALLLIASVGVSACGAGQGYAALVNNAVISRASLDGELKDISHNKPYVKAFDQLQNAPTPIEGTTAGTYNQTFVADLLTQRIEYALIHQELVRRHALPDSATVVQARQEVTQALTVSGAAGGPSQPLFPGFSSNYQDIVVERRAELDALRANLAKAVPEQAVRQYYDQNQSQFMTEICVRHILVTDQATATQLKSQLDAGADFATLAKAHSTDQQSAVKGGQLSGSAPDGCLTSQDAAQLVTQFAQAMVTLPVNQVSQPVQSQFGFHLIEVTSRTIEPYDQRVVQSARQQLGQQAFSNLLKKLVQAASVKVDPQFGHFDKTGSAVVPPKGPQLPSGSGPLGTPGG